ncbi:MAG TPA: hypothetical protein VMB80_18445 [Candidatus Acidoferrum sp.]|nr:hypothetical protein [Candidatus Acidoferrum sp.]
MKSKNLEMQIQRRHLRVAFDAEKVRNCAVSLAPAGTAVGVNRLPRLRPEPARPALLLVSEDGELAARLGRAVSLAGLDFRKTSNPSLACRLAVRHRPAVVGLDLDLPESAIWETAGELLEGTACRGLILLSGRTDHFDLGAAIRAGAVLDKSGGPARFLEELQGILAAPEGQQVDRKARQRLLVRWLQPHQWPVVMEATPRNWGINE